MYTVLSEGLIFSSREKSTPTPLDPNKSHRFVFECGVRVSTATLPSPQRRSVVQFHFGADLAKPFGILDLGRTVDFLCVYTCFFLRWIPFLWVTRRKKRLIGDRYLVWVHSQSGDCITWAADNTIISVDLR